MLIKLEDILPNKYRDLKTFPLNKDKVEVLKNSIKQTGWWDNVIVRKSKKAGKYELAHGHHRLDALRELGEESAEFIVKDLDDETMLKMMLLENIREGESISAERESIKALVESYAQGELELGAVKGRKDQHRYAPSFILAVEGNASKPYTAKTIEAYLDKAIPESRIKTHLRALEAIEKGLITETQLQHLSIKRTNGLLTSIKSEVNSALRPTPAAPTPEPEVEELSVSDDLLANNAIERLSRLPEEVVTILDMLKTLDFNAGQIEQMISVKKELSDWLPELTIELEKLRSKLKSNKLEVVK